MKSFIRSAGTLASGALGGQILIVLTLPLITRLYAPADLGTYQVVLAFVTIVATVSALGYEKALFISMGAVMRRAHLAYCVRLVALAAVLAMPLYLVLAYLGAPFPLEVAGFSVLPFVGAMVLGRGLFNVFQTAQVAAGEMKRVALTSILRDFVRQGVRIVLGVTMLQPLGLFLAGLAASYAGLGSVFRNSGTTLADLSSMPMSRMRVIARRYRQFPKLQTPSQLLSLTLAQLPLFVAATWYGAQAAGLLTAGLLLINRPFRMAARALADAASARMGLSRRMGDDAESHRFARKSVFFVPLVALPLLVIALYLSPKVVPILLGKAWAGAADYMIASGPLVMSLLIAELSNAALTVQERQGAMMLRQSIALLTMGLAAVATYTLGADLVRALIAMGVANLVVQITFTAAHLGKA